MAIEGQPDNLVTGRFPISVETSGVEPLAEYLEAAVALGYRPLPSQRVTLADTYLDTEAFEILRAGFALRLRRTDTGVHVKLKSLDRPGFDDLESQRVDVGGEVEPGAEPTDPSHWPAAVRDRVRTAAGETPKLLPVCVLHQRRETIPLAEGGGDKISIVAELRVDVVSALAPDDRPLVTFSELDVKPTKEGGASGLPDLTRWLHAMPNHAPATGSKFEQAFHALADHPAGAAGGETGINSDMTMAEAGRLMWRRQLTSMLLNEAGARRGSDVEYVHDMRVATRRARAAARLFGPSFRNRVLREQLDPLRRTGRLLGAVRDLDVLLVNLRKYAQHRPSAEKPGLGEIRAVWRVERRDAYRKLLSWLDGSDYSRFVVGFARLCRTAGEGASPEVARVGHAMPAAILGRFEQVRSYESLIGAATPSPIASLHALRIDCKSLRYGLEPVERLLGDDGGKIIRKLKRLQDLLGELNDAAVAIARLAELNDVVEPEPLAAYVAHQEAILADRAAATPAALLGFVSQETRRTLAIAISKL